MLKRRGSILVVIASLTLIGFAARSEQKSDPSTEASRVSVDEMSPDELAAEAPTRRPDLPAPDVVDCPARVQIFIDKSRSHGPSYSPLINTKPDTDRAQTMQVYLDCSPTPTYNWPVSTGRENHADHAVSGQVYFSTTPAGNFRIDWRTKAYHSKLWNAPMPFANFFLPGIAIHATEPSAYRKLGQRASGGCVRLHGANAETLYRTIDQYGAQNVLITITDGQANF